MKELNWDSRKLRASDLKGLSVDELESLFRTIGEAEIDATQLLIDNKAIISKKILALSRESGTKAQAKLDTLPVLIENTGLPVPKMADIKAGAGDANLLLVNVPATDTVFFEIIKAITLDITQKTKGITPELSVEPMICGNTKGNRLVARWKIEGALSIAQLLALANIAQDCYGQKVQGLDERGKSWEREVKIRALDNKFLRSIWGLYFGPDSMYDSEALGISVSRKFLRDSEAQFLRESHPLDWMSRTTSAKPIETFIEFRDGITNNAKTGLPQDLLINLLVQVSSILAHKAVIDKRICFTAIYRALNRVGAREINYDELYDMQSILERVDTAILIALRRPDLAKEYRFSSRSMLMAGVPGVGKTTLAHYLMNQELDALFITLDATMLEADLRGSSQAGISSTLFRIDQIRKTTGLQVVVMVDDIEYLFAEGEGNGGLIVKALNLLQGVKQKGFLLLASTNNPEFIDPRLYEPQRIGEMVHVPIPNEAIRVGILEKLLACIPLESPEKIVTTAKLLASKTNGWTHRWLDELITRTTLGHAKKIELKAIPEHSGITEEELLNTQKSLQALVGPRHIIKRDREINQFIFKTWEEMGLRGPKTNSD